MQPPRPLAPPDSPFRTLPPVGRAPVTEAPPTASLPDYTDPQAANPTTPKAPQPPSPRPAAPGVAFARTDLESLLAEASRLGASDLHLTRNVPPMIRLDGRLIPMPDQNILAPEAVERLVKGMLTPEQRRRFEDQWELDLSLEYADVGRFRVNVHKQRGTTEAAFRLVNDVIRPLRQLGIPPVIEEFARKNSGLFLVTGPTGSGKTTTMAAIVDQINHERNCMIVTVEDPIEYIHTNRRAVIKQREVTSDTHGFVQALRHVLRQDPDVIVVGEMRDLETIQTALVSAETGHMVFSTLHTPDAVQTVDRVIDVFPPHQQAQTRIQLANTLQAICAQQLLPIPGGRGRVPATEILLVTVGARNIIRQAKTEQLMTVIQTSFDQGMISMDKCLKGLYLQGLISFDDAITRCKFPESFDQI
ncbi:MAG: PilT/PilU family type 4a pilus ATPase [Candidatus Sumerlaeota bacterium]